MRTVMVSIGNSDNKLTQIEWSVFVAGVADTIQGQAEAIHFFGGAANWMPWQNVAWLFDIKEDNIEILKRGLFFEKQEWRQDSIAYLEGETVFL